jgi:ATP-dependent RNA helicase DDX3X
MGNLGIATSFFNEKNRNIVSDLVELLIETNQELPGFLEEMANDRFGGPRRTGNSRGGGGQRYGGSGFGSRDYRYGGGASRGGGNRGYQGSSGGSRGGSSTGGFGKSTKLNFCL